MAIFNSKLLNYQKAIFFRWAISCHHGMLKLHILFETEDQVDALDGGGRTARGAQFLQLYRLLFILLGFDDFNRKSSHISMIFPLKPPFIRDFPASHVWLWDGIFESNFTALKHLNTHTQFRKFVSPDSWQKRCSGVEMTFFRGRSEVSITPFCGVATWPSPWCIYILSTPT